jgi:hypothetical protein
MPRREPERKLRWDRVILALLLLGGGAVALIYYVTK